MSSSDEERMMPYDEYLEQVKPSKDEVDEPPIPEVTITDEVEYR